MNTDQIAVEAARPVFGWDDEEIRIERIKSAIEAARGQWEIEYRARLRDSWRVQAHAGQPWICDCGHPQSDHIHPDPNWCRVNKCNCNDFVVSRADGDGGDQRFAAANQTAAEAEAKLICGVFSSREAGRRATLKNIAIIKSAIEKAYREGWRVGRDFAVAGQRDTATATQSNPAQHTGGRENE